MHRKRPDTSHIPPVRGSVALVMLFVAVGVLVRAAVAQPVADTLAAQRVRPAWHLVVDGVPRYWDVPAWPLDSLQIAARRALADVQKGGYYQARIDSVVVRAVTSDAPAVRFFIERGPRIRIGRLHIEGAQALPADALREVMQTHVGALLDPVELERDMAAVLAQYEEAGYPLAQIRLEKTDLHAGDPPTLHLTLSVEEGPALWLKRVEVTGDVRTSSRLAARAARLKPGTPFTDYDPEVIHRRLADTGLFRRVGEPELQVDTDGGAVVRVPVEEHAPGTFDVVLGYLPPASREASAQVVGSGHLRLDNPFGGGRAAGLRIDRQPGQVSRADVHLTDPYVLGHALRLDVRFTGEQRDSTYGKQTYRLAAGVRMGAETEVFGTVAREVTRPGQGGIQLDGDRQRIPRAVSTFTGLGVRVHRVDRRTNPRRGFRFETTLERGRKTRRFRTVTAEGDTTRRRLNERQERLQLAGRVYVPTFVRQLVALGVDASVVRSETYDRSDLFRMGGATTLRGYDEERFLGHAVGRLLLEYRYQIDRRSFAYLFGDLGVVATPALDGAPARRGWHPGFGLGIQFGTELGLVQVSYALNPEDGHPANGRIHLGLSFEL